MAHLTTACLLSAALAYHVPVPAMQAIQAVEGGQEGQAVCLNADGSCDLGPFQVNDRAWVSTVAQTLGADPVVVHDTLRDDGCWNAQVASWILRQMLDQANGDIPIAIGNYHSHLPLEHMSYREKVQGAMDRLYPGGTPPLLPEGAKAADTPSEGMPALVPPKPAGAPPTAPSGHMVVVNGAAVRVYSGGQAGSASAHGGNEQLRWGHATTGATTVFRGTNLSRTEAEAKRAQQALDAAANE
jgi:hypothetical protein